VPSCSLATRSVATKCQVVLLRSKGNFSNYKTTRNWKVSYRQLLFLLSLANLATNARLSARITLTVQPQRIVPSSSVNHR
jgi:hypothetical protein